GEALARWAAGDEPPARPAARDGELDLAVAAMKAAEDQQQLDVARLGWGRLGWGADEVNQIQKAVAEARARIETGSGDPEEPKCMAELDHNEFCQAPKGHPWDCVTGETTEEKPEPENCEDRADAFAETCLEQDREAIAEACGKGPSTDPCTQEPDHDGDCDWKQNPNTGLNEKQESFI
ncbi:hypothetical protein LCGC14_2597590, partial [marine sediment metagenome]